MDSTVKALERQLALAHDELASAEANATSALTVKNAELEAMAGALAEAKKQVASLEGQLASMQVQTGRLWESCTA